MKEHHPPQRPAFTGSAPCSSSLMQLKRHHHRIAPATLITIPISHYCEKARWALDRAGVEYRERAHLQLLHWAAAWRAGRSRTVPVLVCGDRVLTESADIVAFADERAPADHALASGDPEVRALERDFDERLGPHGRRWMYDALRGRRDIAVRYATTGVPAWERRALPLAYPVVTRVIDRYLDIDAGKAAESEAEVRAVFDSVAERLADGRTYLCGERFTAADLTFAALAAPVLMPPRYGVPLPQPDELPREAAAVVREYRSHPAGEYALKMFRQERRGGG
jgi:glutathione S-transferase